MKTFSKVEKSWIFYDWANSAYATIVMAAVFPIYFTSAAKAAGVAGDVWWGYASSVSSLVIAVAAPVLGAIGDFKGMKKRLWGVFLLIGLAFTLLMAFADQPAWMLVGYAVSFVGFDGANLFYDSFLSDVAEKERMDRVSAQGYAMGYIGGSTIPFVVSILLLTLGSRVGIGSALAVKISIVLTCVWWAVFSLPMLRNVRQVHYVETPVAHLAAGSLSNLARTAKDILLNKRILFFIVAYFFYIDGVGTVITMSTSYGTTLGLGSTFMILALLLTQVLAMPFSILFGRLAERIGSIRIIKAGVCMYVLICVLGFVMGFSLEPHQQAYQAQLTQTIERANPRLSAGTLAAVKEKAAAALLASDRVQTFDDALADIKPAAGETDELKSLGASIGAFLSDDAKAADYERARQRSTVLFWVVAILVSTSQGGIQAISRSFFCKLVPPERSNEFFGFFDIFGKFATVMGPALYALFASLTGRSSVGILSLILLFAVGLATLQAGGRLFRAGTDAPPDRTKTAPPQKAGEETGV